MMEHLAIIADGNRRWAKANGLPTKAGYVQGLNAIEECCHWAIDRGVKYLTVYCFSTENWLRPQGEVDQLMDLARWYFDDRLDWYVHMGIRVRFSGRRDRFDSAMRERMARMEENTRQGGPLTLVFCIDYGGRDEIVRSIQAGARTEEEISNVISCGIPDPDAILRTGGEWRLSNFLLWQSAYSELIFRDILFPELDDVELDEVLAEYRGRKRTYGK